MIRVILCVDCLSGPSWTLRKRELGLPFIVCLCCHVIFQRCVCISWVHEWYQIYLSHIWYCRFHDQRFCYPKCWLEVHALRIPQHSWLTLNTVAIQTGTMICTASFFSCWLLCICIDYIISHTVFIHRPLVWCLQNVLQLVHPCQMLRFHVRALLIQSEVIISSCDVFLLVLKLGSNDYCWVHHI